MSVPLGLEAGISAINTFIDGWNERCEPFVWTRPADDIVKKAT